MTHNERFLRTLNCEPVIREGGFVPGVDHSVPADVSWDNYRAYLDLLTKLVEDIS